MKEINFNKSCKLIGLLKFFHLFNFILVDYILKEIDLSIRKTWQLILIKIVETRNFFVFLISYFGKEKKIDDIF